MSRSRTSLPPPAFEVVDTDEELHDLVAELAGADLYAIDTEFHRERTYYPMVALVQIQWDERLVLIDPLQVDISPLGRVLDGDGLWVMHAAGQDLEVFQRACGTVPGRLFDTQIAAGFAGYSSPSLSALVAGELGIQLAKGDRLTDWLHRPLREKQLQYAATDVVHLSELHSRLADRLRESERLAWAEAECERLRTSARTGTDPEQAYLRIKEARQLRGRALSIAVQLAAWRERTAASRDIPVRHVLSDLAVVTIAQRAPTTKGDLQKVRGVDGRHLRGDTAAHILEVVRTGAQSDPPERDRPTTLDRSLRPAVALVSAWVSQLARDEKIDTALLATRSDIEDFLTDHPESRLATGWRNELVGSRIRRLVEGEAALAFDGAGTLVLEDRSNRPL